MLGIKSRYFIYSIINIHARKNDSVKQVKNHFYEQLKGAYSDCPKNDVKLVMGEAYAKVERKTVHRQYMGDRAHMIVPTKKASD
jgi:hypothetical protein